MNNLVFDRLRQSTAVTHYFDCLAHYKTGCCWSIVQPSGHKGFVVNFLSGLFGLRVRSRPTNEAAFLGGGNAKCVLLGHEAELLAEYMDVFVVGLVLTFVSRLAEFLVEVKGTAR